MTKLPILLFASLPLLAQPGTLINMRKSGICPAATAALPQLAVYTGAALPTCYRLDPSLILDAANGVIRAASAVGWHLVFEQIDMSTLTPIQQPDGLTVRYGYQTKNTPILGQPVDVLYLSFDAKGAIVDFLPQKLKSDGTKVLAFSLKAPALPGDVILVSYPTVEP